MPAEPGYSLIAERGRELRPHSFLAILRGLVPFFIAIAIAFIIQVFIRPMMNDFYAKVFLDIGTNVILAVSLTMVNGFTGQFSIGHAAFMAVGAYTAACITYYGSYRLFGQQIMSEGLTLIELSGRFSSMIPPENRDQPIALLTAGDALYLGSLVVGGIAAAICGYIVGLPSLRLRGDYLAIVTLGFGEIVRVLIQSQTEEPLYDIEEINETPWYELPQYVGGALGFTGVPSYTSLLWVWLFAGITIIVAFRLKQSSFGRAFLSIREDEIAAEAMGIRTTKYKVRAFVIAAFFAGIAGGLFAHTVGVQLNAGELAFQKSFDIVIMVVLGGMGSISGAAIAAAILTILPELLRDPPSIFHPWSLLTLGVVAVAIAIFARYKLRALVWLVVAAAGWEIVRRAALSAGINLADYRMVLYALALILMMILRPQGLFGVREIWNLRPSHLATKKRGDFAARGESGEAGKEPVQ